MGRHFGVAIVGVDGNCSYTISDELLGERHADTLHDAAFDLAFGRKPVDDGTRIMRCDVASDLHMARRGVHFHFGEMSGKALSLDVFKRRIGGRAADEIAGTCNRPPESDFLGRIKLHEYLTVAPIQFFRLTLQLPRRDSENLFAHVLRCGDHRRTGKWCSTAPRLAD